MIRSWGISSTQRLQFRPAAVARTPHNQTEGCELFGFYVLIACLAMLALLAHALEI
jgi:hypothetical protein